MNFCTKCASYYQTPGTCNCYAARVAPIYPQPWTPTPWINPYPHPWTTGTITITTTPNDGTTTWYNVKASVLPPTQPITSGYSAPVT